jgi:hypothetical protein
MRYDALKARDPHDWLDLDEQERIDQVIEYSVLMGIVFDAFRNPEGKQPLMYCRWWQDAG